MDEGQEWCRCGGLLVRLGMDNLLVDDEGFGEASVVYRCKSCHAIQSLDEPVFEPPREPGPSSR